MSIKELSHETEMDDLNVNIKESPLIYYIFISQGSPFNKSAHVNLLPLQKVRVYNIFLTFIQITN